MRLLIVGDVMLDRFVYGDVQRISPEAPTPVLTSRRITRMVGGAGNVARGVAALGANAVLIGVVGHDASGEIITHDLLQTLISPQLVFDELRPTTTKTRYVSIEHSSHLLRVDIESSNALSLNAEDMVVGAIDREANYSAIKAIIVSDYGKGVITPRVMETILKHKDRMPVIVDPKRDLSLYRGATIITPNLKELGLEFNAEEHEIASAAYRALHAFGFEHVVVTCGERGILVFNKNNSVTSIPGHPVRVRDVSGAGDTVVAALTVALADGISVEDAARRANDAAAIAVGKHGTSVVTSAELTATKGKIARLDWRLLDQRIAEWRKDGERVGLANGCFDLIHPGHIKLLEEARAMCDKLVVGINSDESVARLKGPGRPIQNEEARARVLAAMDSVDLVVIFGDDTPLRLIERVTPDVLVKGSDYKNTEVIGSKIAGRLAFVDVLEGHSTTNLIGKAK